MKTLIVKQERIGPIAGYHPWAFSGAFESIPEGLQAGEPVKLLSKKGNYLASGYFNSYSQITVRIWGYDKDEEVDERFFSKRIEKAWHIRKKYVEGPLTNAYRVINGENDFLPGLIVDKYADYLVVQFHTRGIERWKNEIVVALEKTLSPKGIYERSDMAARNIENLEKTKGVLSGSIPDIINILENGFKFLVDVKGGQKTGFFLDQRDKRLAFIKYANNASVLNCFSYTGGFSVYAIAGGAKRVVSVDTSENAIELARENVIFNGFDISKCEFVCEDVKKYLKNTEEHFDAVVLDPPAFIKDRRKKKEGIIGYKSINEMALGILLKNGILVTCSCSAHLTLEDFRYLLSEAGGKTRKTLSILECYTHGTDHLQLVPFPEGEYLKCFFLSVSPQEL
ncbi:MAG: class I SAM-dependent rRNA methyltransferase [Proteobacteria bacterium]|nr:class I SAM-dependent rRNA methyltransferase [Pseudomonadota bacterium]